MYKQVDMSFLLFSWARDETGGLSQARQVLYPWAAVTALVGMLLNADYTSKEEI